MEYVLFVLGIVIIFISLLLTYKANKNNDDYYIYSELLSEIQNLKEKTNQQLSNINQQDFQEVLNKKVTNNDDKQLINLIIELKDTILDLEQQIDRLEGKINYSLSRPQQSNGNKSKEKVKNIEHKEYKEIKDLVDQGFSLPEVAQKLDMGTREVKLIWKFNSRGEG